MKNSKFISDSYNELFSANAKDAFLDTIKEMEEAGKWETFKTSSMNMMNVTGPMFMSDIKNQANNEVSDAVIYDTLDVGGSKLFLDTPIGVFPVRSQATSQIISTALAIRNEKQNADEVNDPRFFELLYDAGKKGENRKNRTNQLWVCAGKVTASGSNDYCVMPIDEVFSNTISVLEKKFGTLRFVEGYNSFDYTKAVFEVTGNAATVLTDRYEKTVQNFQHAGVQHLNHAARPIRGMKFMLTIQTSNAKASAAIVSAIIYSDYGARIPVGANIRVDHRKRGGALEGIDLLVDKAPDIYAKFCDPRSRFADLSSTFIDNPRDCLINLCKKAQLPAKLIGDCADNLTAYLCGAPSCSMFDIYLSICEMTVFARTYGYSAQQIDQIEEGLARVLGYRWKECDHTANSSSVN